MDYDLRKLAKFDKVGILGGTFNPVHFGHLAVAEAARDKYGLDIVLFIPTGTPPHKEVAHLAPARHRLNMLYLAVKDNKHFAVSKIEAMRSGISYSIDTIRAVRKFMKPDARLYFIIGADTAALVRTWKEYEIIEDLAAFIVLPRPGSEITASGKDVRAVSGDGIGGLPENAVVLDMPVLDISSSDIRDRIHHDRSAHYLMPEPVLDYIRSRGLYRICRHTIPQLVKYAEQTQTRKRYFHTMGVYETAARLSIRHGADEKKTAIAAILHDCAKDLPDRDKIHMCEKYGITLTRILRQHIDLTHPLIGAKIAADKFGIRDKEILDAIKYHTTGRANMGLIEKIIYVADCIEPYREEFPELYEMRAAALYSIDKALMIGLKSTIEHVKNTGRLVHPLSVKALKYLEQEHA